MMEKLVYKRLYSYAENNNRLPNFQCGFRKQHSCTDLLVYLEHSINTKNSDSTNYSIFRKYLQNDLDENGIIDVEKANKREVKSTNKKSCG